MHGTVGMTLSAEAIERYRQWCIGRGRAGNTVKAYTTDLKEFLKAASPDGTVTPEEYEELAASWLNLTRDKVSPKTTARRLTSIRSYARWAKITQEPLADYTAPKPSKTIPHPIPEGIEGLDRMIEKARNHEQVALVSLGGECGLRISESLSVTTDSLDVESMLLKVRGKGDVTRVIPVSERAWRHISAAYVLAHHRPSHLLVTYKDRHARQIIKDLGERAGLRRKISSHDLRATFATEVFDRTGNIRIVQELLGHSSVDTTQIYTGVQLAKMREAVEL